MCELSAFEAHYERVDKFLTRILSETLNFLPSVFSINIKTIETQNWLHSTVPSKAGKDTTRSSGP